LKDENPYVRKTAALCVAKVFDLKPELCVEYGFIDTLKDLIGDGNPMVCLLCDPVGGKEADK
jgi:vesicle coat complex subunit